MDAFNTSISPDSKGGFAIQKYLSFLLLKQSFCGTELFLQRSDSTHVPEQSLLWVYDALQGALCPFEQAEKLPFPDLLVPVAPRRLPGSCGAY